MVRSSAFVGLVALVLVCLDLGVMGQSNDPCDMFPHSVRESAPNEDLQWNDLDALGGADQIEKIASIEVFSGTYFFIEVVTKICTTYLLKDGKTKKQICHGNGGTSQGKAIFDKGQYLQYINFHQGRFVEFLKFKSTDGAVDGPWGRDTTTNAGLGESSSVILALTGNSGAVLDRLHVVFETNKVYKVRLKVEPSDFSGDIRKVEEENINSPSAHLEVDNRNGPVAQTTKLVVKSTQSTKETSTISFSRQTNIDYEFQWGGGFDVKVFKAQVQHTIRVGTSFKFTDQQSSTETLSKSIDREFPVIAPPFTKVTAQAVWDKVEYEYDWVSAVECKYTFNPGKWFDGRTEGGTMKGEQYIDSTRVVFSYDPPVTPQPTSVPTNDTPQPTGLPTNDTPQPTGLPTEEPNMGLPTIAPTYLPSSSPTDPGCDAPGMDMEIHGEKFDMDCQIVCKPKKKKSLRYR